MKKVLLLFLSASFVFNASACRSETAEISTTTAETASETVTADTSAVTSEAAVSTEPATETSTATVATSITDEKKNYNLKSATISDISEFVSDIEENGQIFPDVDINKFMHWLINENTICFSTENLPYLIQRRQSTRMMKSEADKEIFRLKIEPLDYDYETLNYDEIGWCEPELEFYESSDDGLRARKFVYGYALTDIHKEYTTRGFIKKSDDNRVEFIIDPSAIYGLPLLTNLSECYRFDINGKTVYADTLSVSRLIRPDADISEALYEDRYVYAEIKYRALSVTYTVSNDEELRGYDNTAYITEVNVLTEDTDSVIENGYFESNAKKNTEAENLYRTITDNLDVFYSETTNGITLLDMDFDGTPELLVSDYINAIDSDGKRVSASDISVYRIENGSLKFIDIIPNAISGINKESNDIGLKEFSDGTKGWYITSYKNFRTGENAEEHIGCDYLYRLEEDKLVYEELFTYTEYENDDVDYYIQGELVEITEEERMVTVSDEPEVRRYYYWKDYSSYFGEYELVALWREDYCIDIEKSYNLCSDWLSDNTVFTPVAVTEQELRYYIAYICDCFCSGEYEPSRHTNYYSFMGAYGKPVIYLYPEEETEVSVKVDFADEGEITVSYPEYSGGWNVTAMPDGTIFDESGNEYYCLYWEGEGRAALDLSKGFCVKSGDTADFLREKLMYIGLNAREANEFIIYWLPVLQKNSYNIINLHTEQYKTAVPLTVSPEPDNEIRVFMTFTACDDYVEIEPQQLPAYKRNGFTLVEWGGGEY